MATHDYVIANGTGSAVRSDLNNALAAIVSNNSSSSEPSTKYAYQWWADTTTGQLKLRNSANNGWVTIFELDGTMLMEDGTVSAPGLAFASDLNTGFFSGGADKLNFATGGAERLEIGSSEVVFNDPSNDVDFRVESNGNTHMLFVDAGNDRIGIGAATVDEKLHLEGSSGANTNIKVESTATGSERSSIEFYNGAISRGRVGGDNSFDGLTLDSSTTSGTSVIRFRTAGGSGFNEKARLDASGRLLVGTSSAISGSSTNDNLQLVNSAGSILSVASSDTTIADGTRIGEIEFWGQPGSTWGNFATISCKGDATAASNDNPGRLTFSTTADGASSPTERLKIDSSGTSTFSGTNDGVVQLTTTDSRGAFMRFGQAGSYHNMVGCADGITSGDKEDLGVRAADNIIFATGGSTERARIDSSGRLLVGTSSLIDSSTASNFQIANASGPRLAIGRTDTSVTEGNLLGAIDFYGNDSNGTYQQCSRILAEADGTHGTGDKPSRLAFYTTADGASSATERMRIRSDGYVNAGGFLGTSYHRFNGVNASAGSNLFVVSGYQNSGGTNQDSIVVFACDDSAQTNTASTILKVFRHASTQRSINAAGSINASGNDYAEYMTKAGNFTLAKGDVCGINSEGKLTNVFADAISFVVKSTDPSYVGGDVWHKTVGAEPGGYDDDRTEEEIAAAKIVYEEALEAARQLVDRIAFSGQVPVNVTGATPGQYIVPVTTADGGITGEAKNEANLTLAEYMQAVGKVIAIEDDGRAKIVVKVA